MMKEKLKTLNASVVDKVLRMTKGQSLVDVQEMINNVKHVVFPVICEREGGDFGGFDEEDNIIVRNKTRDAESGWYSKVGNIARERVEQIIKNPASIGEYHKELKQLMYKKPEIERW